MMRAEEGFPFLPLSTKAQTKWSGLLGLTVVPNTGLDDSAGSTIEFEMIGLPSKSPRIGQTVLPTAQNGTGPAAGESLERERERRIGYSSSHSFGN